MLYRCWLCVVLLLPFVISSRNSLHAALCCFSHQPGLSALPSVTAATPAPAIGIQPQVLSLLAAATCRWCARRVLLTTAIHTVACSSPVSAGGALYLHTSRRSVDDDELIYRLVADAGWWQMLNVLRCQLTY